METKEAKPELELILGINESPDYYNIMPNWRFQCIQATTIFKGFVLDIANRIRIGWPSGDKLEKLRNHRVSLQLRDHLSKIPFPFIKSI